MDPTENLRKQLELAKELMEYEDHREEPSRAGDLAELVIALDQWMTRGGFKPAQWDVVPEAQRKVRPSTYPSKKRNRR